MDFISLNSAADKVLLSFMNDKTPKPFKSLRFKDLAGKQTNREDVIKLLLNDPRQYLFIVRDLTLEDLAGSLIAEIVIQSDNHPEKIWRSIDKVITNCRACIVDKELNLKDCSKAFKGDVLLLVEVS